MLPFQVARIVRPASPDGCQLAPENFLSVLRGSGFAQLDDRELQERLGTAVLDGFGPGGDQRFFGFLGLRGGKPLRDRDDDGAHGNRGWLSGGSGRSASGSGGLGDGCGASLR